MPGHVDDLRDSENVSEGRARMQVFGRDGMYDRCWEGAVEAEV